LKWTSSSSPLCGLRRSFWPANASSRRYGE
jgi:hypothetical protein